MTGQGIAESTLKREAYFIDYAEKVRALVDTSLVVTGGFRTAGGMQSALESGATDMVGIARALAIETDFPNRLLSDPNAGIQLRTLSTGIAAVDQMAMLEGTWYENQLALIGRGKKPKPKLNVWISIFQTTRTIVRYVLRSRRA
jgi:hypothetical protein